MIKDLLEYTRARLGRSIPFAPEAGDMGQICRMAYDEIRAVHPERVFRLKISGDLNTKFDADRLQQVLVNLLNNAVRHGERSEPVTLSAHGDATKITLRVKNRGRAIPVDQLQVIFNPLVQIPSALIDEDADSSTSLGLGLYIAREIVVMHGGTIEAESSEGSTVFRAQIPKTSAEARP